jgi:CRISPR-associated protein Cas1
MARHYYLTRAGRLRRKDKTLAFEPSAEKEVAEEAENGAATEEAENALPPMELSESLLHLADGNELGDLSFDSPDEQFAVKEDESESEKPVRVTERRTIPIEDVDALWVFGELDVNSRALVFLSQNKIPVHFFNYYGFYAGTFYPREYLQAGFVLTRQVRHYSNKRLRVSIAKQFIDAGLHNIMRNLRYYGSRGANVMAQTETLQAEIFRLATVKRIDELMGLEGRARTAYYSAFSGILKDAGDFTKRVRRPPNNMVNALMSFANGLTYTAVLTQIYRSQLDPTISFLHEPGYRRFSLALDLAEIFKPVLADRLLFKMLNTKQLTAKDFAQDLNCCYLKESGRKKVLQVWNDRLQTTIEHRRLKRKVSYERLIRLECYKLVKHLVNDEPYKGFKAWW